MEEFVVIITIVVLICLVFGNTEGCELKVTKEESPIEEFDTPEAAVMAKKVDAVHELDEITWEDFFYAIRTVETGGHPDPMNAKGEAGELGPYQITRAYYSDSKRELNRYYTDSNTYLDVKYVEFCEACMRAYWYRYCKDAMLARDWERLARCHNGGPRGHKKEATLKYWKKVEALL